MSEFSGKNIIDAIELIGTANQLYGYKLNHWLSRDLENEWISIGIYRECKNYGEAKNFLENEKKDSPESAGKIISYTTLDFNSAMWQNKASWIIPSQIVVRKGQNWSFWQANKLENSVITPREIKSEFLKLSNKKSYIDSSDSLLKPEYAEWTNRVNYIKNAIISGCINKAVLSRTESRELGPIEWKQLFDNVAADSLNSYVIQLNIDKGTIISNTPEKLFSLDGKIISVDSLAGTRKRGQNQEEDIQIENELLSSEKEIHEQNIVTRAIAKRLEKIGNNIKYPEKPVVRKLKTLQHLYTPVTAELKQGIDVEDILFHLHPTPAMGGNPTEKALKLLVEIGDLPRGYFSAPFGWMSSEEVEFAVNIRSVQVQDNKATFFAGAGIVEDSDAELEWHETAAKLAVMQKYFGVNSDNS